MNEMPEGDEANLYASPEAGPSKLGIPHWAYFIFWTATCVFLFIGLLLCEVLFSNDTLIHDTYFVVTLAFPHSTTLLAVMTGVGWLIGVVRLRRHRFHRGVAQPYWRRSAEN